MSYLLDTHVLLWWLADSQKLTKKAQALIQSEESTLLVSSISLWEIRIKQGLGKIQCPANLIQTLTQQGFLQLSVNWDHAEQVSILPIHHKDPFDRMLIAQAMVEKLTIVTADSSFLQYGVQTSW